MKITLAVPEGKDYKKRLQSELALARNIKSKDTRGSIIMGLTKILDHYEDGKVFLWDGELEIYDYPLNEFIYYCGNQFTLPKNTEFGSKYLLVTMDANECTIGLLNGKRIQTLWNETSNVPRKHNKGGQSKERFQRGRENQLKQWHKKVGRKISEVYPPVV